MHQTCHDIEYAIVLLWIQLEQEGKTFRKHERQKEQKTIRGSEWELLENEALELENDRRDLRFRECYIFQWDRGNFPI
jgi:hypothetical protein